MTVKKYRNFFVLIFFLILAFASGYYLNYICNAIALMSLEDSLRESSEFNASLDEGYYSPERHEKIRVIVAIPKDMLDKDDKQNSELAKSFLADRNEWRQIDIKSEGIKEDWFEHRVYVFKTMPGIKKLLYEE